jgi:hypothetical protein
MENRVRKGLRRPLFIELEEGDFKKMRSVEVAVLKVVCPDKMASMSLILKNDDAPPDGNETVPTITAKVRWKRLAHLLRPGSSVVFKSDENFIPFRFERVSSDHIFSESSVLEEPAHKAVN